MSSDDKGLFVPDAQRDREDAFVKALYAFNSNLGLHLGSETRWTRFFKVMRRDDGSWIAILGSLSEEQEPIVCFGNGNSLLKAVDSLGRSVAGEEWREDKYAKRT